MTRASNISEIAFALPEQVVTNEVLASEHPDWNMARVARRTGVTSRHIASADETALDLGTRAAKDALSVAGVDADSISALIFCTQTPDYPLPPNSCQLQERLRLREDIPVLDINHACSGFIYGISVCSALAGDDGVALLVNGDTYSKIIAEDDRSTKTVFGDGAAATLLRSSPSPGSLLVIDTILGSSGAGHERFMVCQGGARSSERGVEPHITMDGLGMLNFVLEKIPAAIDTLLARNLLGRDEIDLWVFHQASRVAVNALRDEMSLAENRVILDMEDIGNLVSASIPVCIARARERGQFQRGMRVVAAGFGVGLSWGASLMTVS